MQNHDQFFIAQNVCRPNIIRGENAVLLDGNSIEAGLNVLGIDVLAAGGHDHVFLATKKL